LLAAIPSLRGFAYSLCGNAVLADDLVQETLVKAWANSASFQLGTNLRAWLFTILRNEFYSQMRKKGRDVQDTDGEIANRVADRGGQEGHLQLKELREALAELSPDQREALVLVGASGMSYEEAAEICGANIGTIKSRVSRARARLCELLGDEYADISPAI
jgi:RNA polymerase sigma-70 factor (ECF subfamily)